MKFTLTIQNNSSQKFEIKVGLFQKISVNGSRYQGVLCQEPVASLSREEEENLKIEKNTDQIEISSQLLLPLSEENGSFHGDEILASIDHCKQWKVEHELVVIFKAGDIQTSLKQLFSKELKIEIPLSIYAPSLTSHSTLSLE